MSSDPPCNVWFTTVPFQRWQCLIYNGTLSKMAMSDLQRYPCKDGNVWFTTVPLQRWQCLIYNGTLKSFVWSKMFSSDIFSITYFKPKMRKSLSQRKCNLLHFLKIKLHLKSHKIDGLKLGFLNKRDFGIYAAKTS